MCRYVFLNSPMINRLGFERVVNQVINMCPSTRSSPHFQHRLARASAGMQLQLQGRVVKGGSWGLAGELETGVRLKRGRPE